MLKKGINKKQTRRKKNSLSDPFCQGPYVGLPWQARMPRSFLFVALGADNMSFVLLCFEKKKKMTHYLFLHRMWSLWWLKNQGLSVFYPKINFSTHLFFFFTKNTYKNLRNCVKLINVLKKNKKASQKPKSIQNKKSTQTQIYFFMNFEGKKKPNSHQ